MHLTIRNLIDDETGRTNTAVLKAMARRRAIAETGFASPRAIRAALHHYRDFIVPLQCAWRQSRGLPVATTMVEVPTWGASGDSFARAR